MSFDGKESGWAQVLGHVLASIGIDIGSIGLKLSEMGLWVEGGFERCLLYHAS